MIGRNDEPRTSCPPLFALAARHATSGSNAATASVLEGWRDGESSGCLPDARGVRAGESADMRTHCLTRRQVLVSAGGASLVLLAPGWLSAGRPEVALADDAVIAPVRLATYAAVVTALVQDPGVQLEADTAAVTVDDFATHYAAADESFRAWAEAALDEINRAPGGDGFAQLQPADAYAALRGWSSAGPDDAEVPDQRRGLAATALALASLTFAEDELRMMGYTLTPA
jgi:hypothetical protein